MMAVRREEEPLNYIMQELRRYYHRGTGGLVDLNHAQYILNRTVGLSMNNLDRFYIAHNPGQEINILYNVDSVHNFKEVVFEC